MPSPEPTSFSPRAAIATTTSSGHSLAARIGSAKLSLPSGALPACISTKPPKIERAAEPEPRLARRLNSVGESVRPSAAAPAPTSAANPDAEDASPAPVGKLLRLTTRARADVDRKSTRLNSSHVKISYAVFCLKKKRQDNHKKN